MSPKTGSQRSAARHRHRERWYDYRDADGNVVGCKFRFVLTEMREEFGSWAAVRVGKSFSWETDLPLKGAQASLYQLRDVIMATAGIGETVRVPTVPRSFLSTPRRQNMAYRPLAFGSTNR